MKPFHRPGDPHYHTEGTELLPWYRIATLSDPSNTRMYTIGSWWLKSLGDPEQSREAVEFLNEGIRNNPNAFELHVMRAFILRDLDRMDEAHASFMRAAEIANTQYLADKGDPEKWDDTRIEQAYSAFNMAILMTRDGQGTQTAAQLARTYTRTFPSPNPMERILRSLQKQ